MKKSLKNTFYSLFFGFFILTNVKTKAQIVLPGHVIKYCEVRLIKKRTISQLTESATKPDYVINGKKYKNEWTFSATVQYKGLQKNGFSKNWQDHVFRDSIIEKQLDSVQLLETNIAVLEFMHNHNWIFVYAMPETGIDISVGQTIFFKRDFLAQDVL